MSYAHSAENGRMQHYHSYWGKADKQDNCHLLAYHCLDVAACAFVLLEKVAFPTWNSLVQQITGDDYKKILPFIIGAHDIGKFSKLFQYKNITAAQKIYNPSIDNLDSGQGYMHHSEMGLALIKHGLNGLELPVVKQFMPWMEVVMGHYGLPVTLTANGRRGRSERIVDEWFTGDNKDAARNFLLDVATLFELNKIQIDIDSYFLNISSWWLAGFTSISDWLGTNQNFFQFQTEKIELNDYWRKTLVQAELAVSQTGLIQKKVAISRTYKEMFDIDEPTPLQDAIEKLDYNVDGPQLIIIEEATGGGKTEAVIMFVSQKEYQKHLEKGLNMGHISDAVDYATKTFHTISSANQNIFEEYPQKSSGIWDRILYNSQDEWVVVIGEHGHIITSYKFDGDFNDLLAKHIKEHGAKISKGGENEELTRETKRLYDRLRLFYGG